MPEALNRDLTIGADFLGQYQVLSELGAGRFGWVYRARQRSTGQDVAIKVLRVHPADSGADVANQVERFRREMGLCAGLSHPNIVSLIDSGQSDDGTLYAVFEYVPGSTLRDVIAAEGRLPLGEALHLMAQVLDALSAAHARGVVHRDMKPENIMVTRTGARRNALVLDFGLSGFTQDAEGWVLPRLTATQEMMGTPCYAAPEQLRGEPASTRSDLYSWGLILLECLTGELAVGGGSGHEVILKQLGPDPVAIPSWLRSRRLGRLLEIVTAKLIDKRAVTAEGLLEALAQIERGEIPARSEATAPEALPEGERRQLTVVSCRLTVTPLGGRRLDPEEVDELVHAQHAIFAELAGRASGQVGSVLADRVLLVFGHPRAREDDARRAARTALQIAAEVGRASGRLEGERGLRLEVRIGVHTGVVVVRELRLATYQGLYDLVGPTPEIAARLDERAAAGEVLVSGDTQRLLRGEITAEPSGQLRPWEDSDPIPLFRLTGEDRRHGLETVAWVRETPLVGRALEFRRLLAAWEQAQAGRAVAILLAGEPGIGKSRLVRELRRRVPIDGWLEGRCGAENQASPLRPIVDLLLAAREPIAALLAHHGFDFAETLPLFTALLGIPLDPLYPPLQLTPDRRKELTLSAVLSLVLRMAQERPLVLAVEDLHWADPTTLELVTQLVQEVQSGQRVPGERASRLCLLFTARPEFGPPWSLEDASLIQLVRLDRPDIEQMIAGALVAGQSVTDTLLEQVVRHSDGVPLFVEEITRVLMASPRRGLGTSAVEIPTSLRDLLTARLDQLSPSAREAVQLAAVLGREFRYELLECVARKSEPLLREDVSELIRAGLLYARRSVRAATYLFKHSLVRDAAYDSLTRARRRSLHAQVASTLRERFPDVEEQQPELLALHFENAGDVVTAVTYWHRAGERALKRAAYAEALQLLQHGLTVLEGMSESSTRLRLELELLTTLGTVQFSTQGAGTEEVQQTFTRARALCDRLGDDLSHGVLTGLFVVPYVRGDREATAALVPRFERLLDLTDDPVSCISGRAALGQLAFWRGDFLAARDHLAVGIQFYGTDEFQRFVRESGWDGGLFCHAYEMCALWNLGYPDQAEARRRELVAIAEATGNPYSILIALGFGTTLLYDRGDMEATLQTSERIIALSTEQRLYPWLAGGLCGRGAALVERGSFEEAVAQIEQGLNLYLGIGLRCSYSYYLTYQAAALRAAGRPTDALGVVEQGLALCETLFAHHHESELLRLKGELLDAMGDRDGAEAALRAALDIARRRNARSLELRAAMSLARLLRDRGAADEARALLGAVYSWFTEGFDTGDLRRARGLLAELG